MAAEDDFRRSLAEALGLAPDAADEDILALARRLATVLAGLTGRPIDAATATAERLPAAHDPDPARHVPVAAVQAMLGERNAALSSLSESRAMEKVADAMRRGYLSPAMRHWALALCRSDEAAFDSFMASTVPAFAHLFTEILPNGSPRSEARVSVSPEAEAICAQLGLAPDALNGR